MNSPIRVLHVEDDSFDRERVREVLSQAGGFSVVETERQRDFERLLAAEEWDCVLTDLQLSGYTGFDVLDRVRGLHPETPVVFLTGTGSEEYAVEAMKRGAADYILKAPSHYGKLPLALRNAVAAQRAREDKLRAEKALERSAAAYRQLFQSNPHPMWVYDLETLAFIEVNDATVSKYGWSRDEFLRMTLHDIRLAEEVPQALDAGAMVKAERGGGVWRHRTRDGAQLYMEVVSHVIDWQGRRAEVALANDVTERIRVEEEVREALGELNTIYQATPAGIALVSNRNLLRANAAFAEIVGRPREALIWMDTVGLFLSEEDARRYWDLAEPQLASQGRYACERQLRRADGALRWVRLTAQAIDRAAAWKGMVWVAEDLEEARRTGQESRKLAEYLAESQRVGHMGSWSLDPLTGRLTWSAEQYRLFGMDPAGPAPNIDEFLDLVHEEDRAALRAAVAGCLERGESRELEFRIRPRSGGERWVRGSLHAERDAEGRVVRAYGVKLDITEEKRARDEIRRSRDFYLTLFEKFPTMVWQTGPDGGCNFVNRAWVDFTGVPTDSALGNGWQEWMHPEDRARELAGFAEAFEARKPVQAEYRLRHAGGDYRWVQDFGGPYYDLDGKFAGYIGTCVDVTERRLAVQRLEESEERLREIVQNMPVMLDAFDEQGRVIAWNAECERVTGYSAKEIVGNPGAMELLYPDAEYRERMLREWQSRGHFYRGWEWRLTAKDGTERAVLWSNQSEQYRVPGWTTWGVGVDVTEHRRVEQSLHAAEHRFRTLVDQAADCMFITDLEGRIVDCNEAACERLGYTREELLAMNLTQIDPAAAALPPDELRRLHASTIGRKIVFEGVHRRRDGSSYPVEARIAGVRFSGKEYVIGLARDVTERRRAEQALRESEERFRALIETATDFIAILGADGFIQYVSPSLTNVLGHLPQDVLAHNYLEFVHPDDVARASAALASLLAQPRGVTKIEVRVRTREGAFRRLDIVARNVLDVPSIGGVVATARDLTGRVVPA